MADLSKMLAKAKKSWTESVDKAASIGITFPDGKFVMQWIGTEAKEASTGTFGISNQWLIVEGEKEGDTYYQWINLFNDEDEISSFAIQFLKLVTGQDPADLDITQIETILEDALAEDQFYSTILKTTTSKKDGNEYQNLRIGRRLHDFVAGTEEAEEVVKPGKTTEPKPGSTTPKSAAAKAKPAAKVVEPEPEPEEEEDDTEASFEKGDEVTFTVTTGKGKAAKTETLSGTVLSVDEEEESLEVKTGGTAKKPISQTVPFANVVADEADEEEEEEEEEETEEEAEEADEDEEGESYAEGDEVTFELEGEELTGTITGVDDEAEELEVEVETGTGRKKTKTSYTVPFADIVGEEGQEIEVGSKVAFTDPGNSKKELNGNVTKLDDDKEIATVKVGAKTFPVPYADLILIIDEE